MYWGSETYPVPLAVTLTRFSVLLIPNTQTQHHSGNKSASARREPKEVYGEDAGGLEQMIDAHQYRGKQIQLEATVKVRVIGTGNQAHLWLRVNGKNGDSSCFDADLDHPIVVNGWRYFQRRCHVDENAETIEYGLALVGAGEASLDDVSLRVVRPSVRK